MNPAPREVTPVKFKDVMQPAYQPIVGLHKGVSDELNQIGHPTTPESINPNSDSILEDITRRAGDLARVAGGEFDTRVSGEGLETHSGAISGSGPRHWALEKARRLMEFIRQKHKR